MPRLLPRRWLWRGLLAVAVVLVAVGVAALVVVLHKPGNVSHPDLEFTSPTTSTTTAARPRTRKAVDAFQWPVFGFDDARTKDFPAPADLAPPMHLGWTVQDGALLEFPPVIYHQTMFLIDDDANARAINLRTGATLWQHKLGTLAAASPAVAARQHEVLMPVLSTHGNRPGEGRFVALSMKTGQIVWSRPLGAGSETSPVVNGHSVYYGDEQGNLYDRNAANGHLYWAYHAAGAIKGGPALVAGILYFGDYSGHVYAVRALDGRPVWKVGTNGAQFGFGSGEFYATPAVAFGRVYIGNTDGRMYSFGAANGKLAWATATGSYIYSSAAVGDPKGLGPTVYVGSYDENLYAFNAQSGAVRWRHPAGGRISGAPTIIGNVVYYSQLETKTAAGVDAATGRQRFSWPVGAFTTAIADDHAIYLIGYSQIFELLPGAHAAKPHRHQRTPAKRAHPARKRSRRPTRSARHPTGSHRRGRHPTAGRRARAITRKPAAPPKRSAKHPAPAKRHAAGGARDVGHK